MLPETILQIIRLSLEITLEIIKGIPLEQRAEMWKDHEKNIKFWREIFAKVTTLTP